jgi:hypothetical protein
LENSSKANIKSNLLFSYNNGEWHVATATHDGNHLRLSIDDSDHFRSDAPVSMLNIQLGELYFGGLPPEFAVPKHALSSAAYFTGCISDVTVNGNIVNFANLSDYSGGVIGSCSRDLYGKFFAISRCFRFPKIFNFQPMSICTLTQSIILTDLQN